MSNSAKNSKKKLKFFEKLQVSNAKTKEIFFKKKSLSQMIPNRLIRLAENNLWLMLMLSRYLLSPRNP